MSRQAQQRTAAVNGMLIPLCCGSCHQQTFSPHAPALQARKQNPKAFVFSSRGKAKLQRARTAEKEQRRMHGACLGARVHAAKSAVDWCAVTPVA
jgi:hypothetical protein